MGISIELRQRSADVCELCGSAENCDVYVVTPRDGSSADGCIWCCETCRTQADDPATANENHWRCLNSSIWSEVPAVQVVAWRMLQNLKQFDWANDLADTMYMEDATREWAETGINGGEESVVHKDSNGNVLQNGDSVVLIKDLDVKGANFTAKRGTAVRNINLVSDNAGQIEGRVEGQQIVILTQFVKKQ